MRVKNKSSIKIDGKIIIYMQLYLILYTRTLTYFIPELSMVNYLPDVISIILFIFIVCQLITKCLRSDYVFPVSLVMILLFFDIICFLYDGESLLLFLWGIRNQYRFILFFIATILFLEKKDLPVLFSILYKCFVINMCVVTLEFAMGYKQDYLGGTFGLEHNCNGIVNVFLCIIVTYAILGLLYTYVHKTKFIFILIGSMYWSMLAELKVFFVELLIICGIALLIVKINITKKMCFFLTAGIILIWGAGMLTLVYPQQIDYLVNHGVMGYLRNVNLGSHGFGRLSAIPITNNTFFQHSVRNILFGIGTGNAEFMMVGSINYLSKFYETYSSYAYNCYLYAFIYIERGLFGLIWYAVLFTRTLVSAFRYRKKAGNEKLWFDISICTTCCFFIMCIYDSSLRVSASGILAFLILGLPYISVKGNSNDCPKLDKGFDKRNGYDT